MKPSRWQIATLMIAVVAAGCEFIPPASQGVSAALEPPVDDGRVVLLRKGDTYGAFIPVKQSMSPETVTYEWYLRSDALGTFDKADEAVQHDTAVGTSIVFGPLVVGWSGHSEGSGWIYYDRMPDETTTESDVRICVTPYRDVSSIDACDTKWTYKASDTDTGIPGGPISSSHDTQ